MELSVRVASEADIPVLWKVIKVSVCELQKRDYNGRQIKLALKNVYGVDKQLIADGTYYAAEATQDEGSRGAQAWIVGCGGWSKRRTLFGGDQWGARDDDLLDATRDAAKIRAFFVRPEWARRGIGTMILGVCEAAAKAAGFGRLELGATLSGVPFYRAKGYFAIGDVDVPLGQGEVLPIVRMTKAI